MSITEDTGNQPATKTWTGAWTSAQTTASFTAGSGTLIVALLAASGVAPSQTVTGTITDSLSGGWTLLKRENSAQTNEGGTVEVWVRNGGGVGTAAPGAMTVSATGTGSPSTGGQLAVLCLLGADITANQNGATGSAAFNNAAAVQISVAAGTGGKIYGAALNWTNSTNMTALANSSVVAAFSDTTNGDSWEAFRSTGNTAGTATYGYSTSTIGRIAAVEFKAGAVAGGSPPFVPPLGFTSPQQLAANVRWDYTPPAVAAAPTAFPPQSSRPRTPHPPIRRGQSVAPPPVTAAFPPQSTTPRRRPPFRRKGASSGAALITVQPFPPQTPTRPRRFPFRRHAFASDVGPLVQVQTFPPQTTTRRRWAPFRRRGFSSAPTPPTVVVTVYPFQQPSPRRKPWLPPVRRGKSVPPGAPQVTFTAAPYPPQAGGRRARPPFRRRLTSTPPPAPPTVVTVTFPPQTTTRRRTPPFRRRPASSAPTPPQVVFTVYPYPAATPRRRWWLPFRRRGRWFVPPIPPPTGREITIIPDLTTTEYSSDITATRYSADTNSSRYGSGDLTGTRYNSDQTSTRYNSDLNEQ